MWTQLAALVCAGTLASPSTVTVNVGTFRSRTGSVACRLYVDPSGFPESAATAVGQVRRVTGASATCTFDHLPPGRYAVAVIHDEDNDLLLAKNLLGAPTEGYGVSNNRTHLTHGPSFDESAFMVKRGETLSLDVTLRY